MDMKLIDLRPPALSTRAAQVYLDLGLGTQVYLGLLASWVLGFITWVLG
jgi:hypothetical protein